MTEKTRLNRDVEEVLSDISTWEGGIRDSQEYAEVTLYLQRVKEASKHVVEYYEEDRRKQYVEFQKVLIEIFQYGKPLTIAEGALSTAICRYKKSVADKVEDVRDAQALIEAAFPDPTAVALVEIWNFKLTDRDAIPREYLLVDERKIAAAVKEMKGLTDIPGVEVTRSNDIWSTHRQKPVV